MTRNLFVIVYQYFLSECLNVGMSVKPNGFSISVAIGIVVEIAQLLVPGVASLPSLK